MNTQELFDKVADHLLTQNTRATSASGMCAYRGVEGTMCAVGCLITTDAYTSAIEGLTVGDECLMEVLKESLGHEIGMVEEDLLGQLQRIHDNADPRVWADELQATATAFDLNYHGERYGQQPVSA